MRNYIILEFGPRDGCYKFTLSGSEPFILNLKNFYWSKFGDRNSAVESFDRTRDIEEARIIHITVQLPTKKLKLIHTLSAAFLELRYQKRLITTKT